MTPSGQWYCWLSDPDAPQGLAILSFQKRRSPVQHSLRFVSFKTRFALDDPDRAYPHFEFPVKLEPLSDGKVRLHFERGETYWIPEEESGLSWHDCLEELCHRNLTPPVLQRPFPRDFHFKCASPTGYDQDVWLGTCFSKEPLEFVQKLKPRVDEPSIIRRVPWDEFSAKMRERRSGEWFFRGENEVFDPPFRTSLSVANHYDLSDYHEFFCYAWKVLAARCSELVPPFSDDLYPLNTPKAKAHYGKHSGYLLRLLRHYGVQTPVTDVTRSPWVAAFFAFEPENDQPRRIYALNAQACEAIADGPLNHPNLYCPANLFRILKPNASERRLLPMIHREQRQKGAYIRSGIDDLFGVLDLLHRSHCSRLPFLEIYEFDPRERSYVLSNLRKKQITYASLFPDHPKNEILERECAQLEKQFREESWRLYARFQ